MVQVDVDLSQYHDLGPNMKKVTEKGLNLTAQDMVGTLMKNSPVKHGLLKSWFIAEHSATSYTIKSPARYTAAQNWGSVHFIKPKNKKALHWDGEYFSKGHMVHIIGQHFVERSIEQVQPRIAEHFKVAISEVLG